MGSNRLRFTDEQMRIFVQLCNDHTPRGKPLPVMAHVRRELKTKTGLFPAESTLWKVLEHPYKYLERKAKK